MKGLMDKEVEPIWLSLFSDKSRHARKIDLLLIDTFEKGFNPNENGHLETGGLF
jgi:hypothetical protein